MPTVRVPVPAKSTSYEVRIGAGLLKGLGALMRQRFATARMITVVSNKTVFALYGKLTVDSLRGAGFAVNDFQIRDGERHKSLRSLERVLAFLAQNGLQRNDVVVGLGGGVVGDLAGFAAAVYLRGVQHLQIPTTLLAQIDSSVGGKTGVNLELGKNLVGAFHQPSMVLIDPETLRTLPRRELTAGYCEMVKQGTVSGRELFDRTVHLLRRCGADFSLCLGRRESQTEVCATIAAHCRFKASIVSADEREDVSRTDRRSRRVLNFGHTTAHALEKASNYRRFRHGEAVGYGILVASEISKSLGMLPPDELESIRQAVTLCGPLPRADDLAAPQIIEAMSADKKAVAGKVKWILLEGIGKPRIVDSTKIKPSVLRAAMAAGLKPN